MIKNAVVTGAGSGVGRAVALSLARSGWQVGLFGRRAYALDETAGLAGPDRDVLLPCPCDIQDPDAVRRAADQLLAAWGAIEVLVNAAGTNVPQRALATLALDDYRALIDTNLNGAYYCTQAFLPGMRARRSGTIVNIVSDAGKQASPKAGPAYVMSKFGLAGLNQSINAEERANGIRACAIFPGDIDTPLLEKRPQPPEPSVRARMLQSDDVAAAVLFCVSLPPRAIVEELVIRPR